MGDGLIKICAMAVVLSSALTPAVLADDPDFDAALSPFAEALLGAGAPGVIVLRRDGRNVRHFAAGLANIETKSPMLPALSAATASWCGVQIISAAGGIPIPPAHAAAFEIVLKSA